jgi:alkanesulfonate monooxygenase SsuD/methylene tetrahydromethanopterin reductase-like flavin-dependent oxidoreductase (luciferase family)
MRFALDVSTAETYSDARLLSEPAVLAEHAGWDGFFVWDTLLTGAASPIPVADPWITLAAIAMSTQRIRIGAMITPLARRRPWLVARQVATLDQLSGGRMVFGAGLGFSARDFSAFGEVVDARVRAERLDEALDILAGLWKGQPFSFSGKHFSVEDVTLLPRPVQSRIPIWVAAYWPNRRPLRRAARWDGLLPGKTNDAELSVDEFAEMVAYVRARRSRGKPFAVAVYGVSPADPLAAAEVVRPWMEAGATWWREAIEDSLGSADVMRERIRHGPPRLESVGH